MSKHHPYEDKFGIVRGMPEQGGSGVLIPQR